jgi:hypothetical protein
MLPLKTTMEDLEKLLSYLRTQIGLVDLAKVRGALDSKTTDNRKLEAAAYVGLIERDGQKIEITSEGRRFATSLDPGEKATVMAELLARKELYAATVEWMHYTAGPDTLKTAVADYWYKNHEGLLEGAKGAGLTDAVVFFMRFADAAGLGKYVSAGRGRPETYFKGDSDAIARLVLRAPGDTPPDGPASKLAPQLALTATPITNPAPSTPPAPTPQGTAVPVATLKPSRVVNVNIEIHIPSDASPETITRILQSVRDNILLLEED